MPKKSRKKRPRKTVTPRSTPRKTTRPSTPSSPNIWQRMRHNWAATALIALGVIVVASMIIAMIMPGLMPPAPAPTLPPSPTPAPTKAVKSYTAPPPLTIDPTKAYTATVETAKGAIVIQLLPDAAPQTVNSFVFLARDGFYDGLTFHRVEAWVVQGGDPRGDGTGGPGYTVPAEFESSVKYSQVRGIVGLARGQDPNSGSSQWYVVKQDATELDGQYTTFGRVMQGMDVVDRLVTGDVMTRITIQESE